MRTIARVGFWVTLWAVALVTISPLWLRPETGLPPQVERFGAYLAIGLLFGLGYPRLWLLGAVGLVLAAAGLEVAQEVVPGRDARLIDFAVKAAGAVAGTALALGLDPMRGRFRRGRAER